jgi:cobalt/nickel transport system permease protein
MAFGLYVLLLVGLMVLGKIDPVKTARRVVIVIPFMLMGAVFIPFFKEGAIAGSLAIGPLRLTVTYAGLMILWNIAIKSMLSVWAMSILVLSTSYPDLLSGLARLRIPRLFVQILSFMLRYFDVLADELSRMRTARASRTVKSRRTFEIRALANMIALLFIRSYERAERVYLAMCSRGYSGSMPAISIPQIKNFDVIFSVLILMLFLASRIIGAIH